MCISQTLNVSVDCESVSQRLVCGYRLSSLSIEGISLPLPRLPSEQGTAKSSTRRVHTHGPPDETRGYGGRRPADGGRAGGKRGQETEWNGWAKRAQPARLAYRQHGRRQYADVDIERPALVQPRAAQDRAAVGVRGVRSAAKARLHAHWRRRPLWRLTHLPRCERHADAISLIASPPAHSKRSR